ncbi:GSCOCG00008749001-RA-CDS [Cotesia congregata]|nr:GSCOCG00008749001-RA-CDS [Cotesia congregata]
MYLTPLNENVAPFCMVIDPRKLGNFETSILPISQNNTLLTGSNEYFPWFGTKVQFRTILGIGISSVTFSTLIKIKN